LKYLSYFPATNDMAVQYIVGIGEPENFGRSFTFLLTRAWPSGCLPGQWDDLSKKYFEHVQKRRADYLKARQQFGAAAVNEGRARF
jgi:hypothetical protein